MKYDKMLMLLTLVAAGLAAGCSDDEDPLKDWTGPSKPGTEIKTPAEVGNRVVAHRGGSTEAGTRQFPDNSVAALNYAIGLGCYASECDIYLTKDDDVVVAHASAGCYINNLKPWEHTLAELRAAGTLANGEQLPSLADFIDVVLEAGTTRLWLDVKNILVDGSSAGYTTANRPKRGARLRPGRVRGRARSSKRWARRISASSSSRAMRRKSVRAALSPSGSVRSPRRAPWAAMPGG